MYGGLRLEDFTIVKEIGKGGFGVVYEATHPQLKRVALKKIVSGAGGVHASKIKSEYELLNKVNHNNVVKLYGYFKHNHDHYLVMELCEFGSIRSYVRKNGPLSDPSAAYVLKQLVCAVRQCHKMKVIHRDLSAGNILISRISSKGLLTVKICDFGLARTLSVYGGAAQTVVGTPGFMAPELLGGDYNETADVYSLGAALFTMLTAEDPPTGGKLPSLVKLSSLAAALISEMMCEDGKRIPLRDILSAQFMTVHVESCEERHSRQMNLSSREFSADRRGTSTERRMAFGIEKDRRGIDGGDRRSWSRERENLDRGYVRRSRETSREAVVRNIENTKARKSNSEAEYLPAAHRSRNLPPQPAHDENVAPVRRLQVRARSSSQPPQMLRDSRVPSRNRESGFESAGDQQVPLAATAPYRGSGGNTDTGSSRSRNRSTVTPVWPLKTVRLNGRVFVRPKVGRLRVSDAGHICFEEETERGLVGCVMQIQTDGVNQEVLIYSPLLNCVTSPKQGDPAVELNKATRKGPFRSLSSLSSDDRNTYAQARIMLSQLRSQVDKLILRRPVQFPWAQAKIMESGDFRVVPISDESSGEKLVRKMTNGKVVFRRYLGNSGGVDITDGDTLARMNAVYNFLLEMESCVEKSGQPFPFVMTAGQTSTSPQASTSRVQSAMGSRSRLYTNPLSLVQSAASAPATVDSRRAPLMELRQGMRRDGDKYMVKDIGRGCFSVKHVAEGRFLRMSTATPNLLIYRSNEFDAANERRFSVKDATLPAEALDLVDKLKEVLRERRMNNMGRA